ncbi:MAG: hypothetical protein H7246_14460 [Phycisphaerae bacterium]|nr:hypothetical protein [Saprospiraceae bacterium]
MGKGLHGFALAWHGGEAEKPRNEFKKLLAEDRVAVLAFLNAL